MKLKYFILALILGTSVTMTKAQDYDLGVFAGASFYRGDLTPTAVNGLRGTRPAGGVLARLNMNPHFSLRGNFNIGYIAAYDRLNNPGSSQEDVDRKARNLSFHAPVFELSGMLEVNLMKYIAGSKKYKFAPYIFGGVAAAYSSPKAFLNGDRVALAGVETEPGKSYSPIKIAIPFGLGIKYNISKNWTLGFEFGPRLTFTDYLDDVSTTYNVNAAPGSDAAMLSNRTGKPVSATSLRGNSNNNDWYYFTGITLYKTIRPYRCN
ncbi:MAG: hypothetical protein EP332_14745 [Bacteroidetes bacterium]|nr:MAG: hypothetical protein EP332_14745 [Bacteroidota bacterium]